MESLMVVGDLYQVTNERRLQGHTAADLKRPNMLITRRQADRINAFFEGGSLQKFVINDVATEEYYELSIKAKEERDEKAKTAEIAKTGVADALLAKVLGGVGTSSETVSVDNEREELKELATKYGIKVGRSSNDTLRKKIEEFESNQD